MKENIRKIVYSDNELIEDAKDMIVDEIFKRFKIGMDIQDILNQLKKEWLFCVKLKLK